MPSSPKRALYTVAAPLLLLGDCRGVVGIQDLDVVADGGASGGGGDAAADHVVATEAGAHDGGLHVAIDAGCASSAGMECGKCCRMAAVLMPAFAKLDKLAKDEGCICGAGSCGGANECGPTVCAGAASNGMCGGCVDMSIHPMPPASASSACMVAETACASDQVCSDRDRVPEVVQSLRGSPLY